MPRGGLRRWRMMAVIVAFVSGAAAAREIMRRHYRRDDSAGAGAERQSSADDSPADDTSLSYSEMQKLDDGAYITEIRKQQAAAATRTRDAADRSWKIAATFAGVIIATGFTDKLRSAPYWVQGLGILAIVLWLVVSALFIRVNRIPAVGSQAWAPYAARETARMQTEIDEAEQGGDRIRKREVEARLANRTTLALVTHRFTIASASTVAALAITGAALTTASLVGARSTARTGRPQLTVDGQSAIVNACAQLDPQSIKTVTVRLDPNEVGADEPVAIHFDAGVCADHAVTVYVPGTQITAFRES